MIYLKTFWKDIKNLMLTSPKSQLNAYNLNKMETGISAAVGFSTAGELKAFSATDVVTRINLDGSWWNFNHTSVAKEDGGEYAGTVIAKFNNASTPGRWIRDFDVVYFEHFGAVGDGIADDTNALCLALKSGHSAVYGKNDKTYKIDPIEINSTSLKRIGCAGTCSIMINSSMNSVGLQTAPRCQFISVDNIHFYSSSSASDGLNFSGLKIGDSSSIVRIGKNVRFFGFSGDSLSIGQCVHCEIDSPIINMGADRGIGIHLTKVNNIPCTTVVIRRPYIFGGTNGLRSEGCVDLTLESPVFELGGSSATVDGALHIIGGTTLIKQMYFEGCQRNYVLNETVVTIVGDGFGTNWQGVSPNLVTYNAVGFERRGISKLSHSDLNIRRIGPDYISKRDLVIGENLTVPLNGGSVSFDGLEVTVIKGTAISGEWTTIALLDGQSGPGQKRASYSYSVYAGSADKTLGYDSGNILNGAIYSHSGGNTPDWLRVESEKLQIKIVRADYGLNYGVRLIKSTEIGS